MLDYIVSLANPLATETSLADLSSSSRFFSPYLDNRARPEGDVATRYWTMETTKGRSFRLIPIPEIEIAKSKKESSMAMN
ncbi:hypothetical protein YC2023_072948 [Brassica napus]